MKILKNLIPGIRILWALRYLRKYKKQIAAARAAGDFEKEREAILGATTCWGKHLCEAFGVQIEVNGYENLPEKGPVVFVANHQSYADIPVTCAVLDKFQFGFVAKDILEKLPFYGWWIKNIRGVYIHRESSSSARALVEGMKLLDQGFSLVIYPEGTRSRGPQMGEFRKTALRLALKGSYPIVPIAMDGSYKMFERDGYFHGDSVRFTILPPIDTTGLGKGDLDELSDGIHSAISSVLQTS